MFISFILSLFCHLMIVDAALHHSKASVKRGFFLKSTDPASNDSASTTSQNVNATIPITVGYPEPQRGDSTTCTNSSKKPVTFVDRECWHAAKTMAEDGTAFSQCGTCVLGLYDADKKEPFKTSGPLNATLFEEQAMMLLTQCKNQAAPKVAKRDAAPADPINKGTNVQLLMGYKPEAKPCPGL